MDTVGDPGKYEVKLLKRFPKLKIKVSKKADSLFPCVSAASICAKVIRDNVLKNWVYTEDLTVKEYGSGYPGDPKTKMFLDSNINQVFGFVKLIRFSWSTAATKLHKSCVQIRWNDGDGDEVFDEDFDQNEIDLTEENDRSAIKPTKKSAAKPKSSKKLAAAVVKEKNNSSLLSFFQKPSQKRTISASNSCADIVSHFMLNNKLKCCTHF